MKEDGDVRIFWIEKDWWVRRVSWLLQRELGATHKQRRKFATKAELNKEKVATGGRLDNQQVGAFTEELMEEGSAWPTGWHPSLLLGAFPLRWGFPSCNPSTDSENS